MVDVFLTFDTELSPGLHAIHRVSPEENYRRCIEGRCARGRYGVPYLLEVLAEHELRGVFFVETLCASIVGDDLIRKIFGEVRDAGHDVQLHVHTEWLRFESTPWRPHTEVLNIHLFDRERQQEILSRAMQTFERCVGITPCAYRAGNYGANLDTLEALHGLGITFDSSHNAAYLDRGCQMATLGRPNQALQVNHTWEVPISAFQDRPGHVQPAQLGSCSFREMRSALEFAWENDLSTFVIVAHSFELMNIRRTAPLPLLVRRFTRLCEYLSRNSDRFRVIGFDQARPESWKAGPDAMYRSRPTDTLQRLAEQVFVRIAR